MDSLAAFARGEANRGKPSMVFDWDRAASLIRERGTRRAAAGLRGDWEWTGGLILVDGKPVPKEDTYTYLASTWAVPELRLDGDDEIECYRMGDEVPDWDSGTYWPPSALAILRGDVVWDTDGGE